MALDEAAIRRLIEIKQEVEEILEQVADVIPTELFRTTMVLRYVGAEPEIREFFNTDPAVWTDDVSYDIVKEIERHRVVREEA